MVLLQIFVPQLNLFFDNLSDMILDIEILKIVGLNLGEITVVASIILTGEICRRMFCKEKK